MHGWLAAGTALASCLTRPLLPALLLPPQVLALISSDNYLHRMTVLAAIGALAGCVSKEVVHNQMLPSVVACTKVRRGMLWRCRSLACGSRRLAGVGRAGTNFAVALRTLQDRVPNVRFNAAKILQQLAALSDTPAVSQTIRPALTELTADKDSDVRFYATVAAGSIG